MSKFIRIKGGEFNNVYGQMHESDILINIKSIATIYPQSGIITLVNGEMYASSEPLDFVTEALDLLELGKGDDALEGDAQRLDTSIYAIGLEKRTITPLTSKGVRCVGDLYSLDPNIRMRNFGVGCYLDLKCALLTHNFECVEWYKYERDLEKRKNKENNEEVSK